MTFNIIHSSIDFKWFLNYSCLLLTTSVRLWNLLRKTGGKLSIDFIQQHTNCCKKLQAFCILDKWEKILNFASPRLKYIIWIKIQLVSTTKLSSMKSQVSLTWQWIMSEWRVKKRAKLNWNFTLILFSSASLFTCHSDSDVNMMIIVFAFRRYFLFTFNCAQIYDLSCPRASNMHSEKLLNSWTLFIFICKKKLYRLNKNWPCSNLSFRTTIRDNWWWRFLCVYGALVSLLISSIVSSKSEGISSLRTIEETWFDLPFFGHFKWVHFAINLSIFSSTVKAANIN